MTLDSAYSEIAACYPLVTRTIEIASHPWEITSVEDQSELVRRVQSDTDLANFPFGLMLWPSAIGLSQALLERPALVAGRSVIELGCGMGVAGLAAAAAGAASVTQTDFLEDALTLTRWNACRNAERLRQAPIVRSGDWRDFSPDLLGPYDLVVGADVLYERSLHSHIENLLPRLIGAAGQVLLSDPLRPQAMDFLDRLDAGGGWNIGIDSVKVNARDTSKAASPFGQHEIALFTLQRRI